MGNLTRSAALAAALSVAAAPAGAQAPECLSEAEVSALVTYAMPHAVEGMRLRCSASLANTGFLSREGTSFAARYAALQDRAWPEARSALTSLVLTRDTDLDRGGLGSFVQDLPDDALRPLVNSLIVQKVRQEVRPDQCAGVERVMEAMAPIEPEVASHLLGVIAGVAEIKEPAICKADPA